MLIYVLKVIGHEEWIDSLKKLDTPDMIIHAQLGESIWDQVNEMFTECGKDPDSYNIDIVLFGHFGLKHNEFIAELEQKNLNITVVPEIGQKIPRR